MAQVSQNVKTATGSTWKKVLWWCIGILGVLGAITLILWLLKRQGPVTASQDIIDNVKHQVDKIDIEAKVKIAQAEGVEQVVIDRINSAASIKDERERLQALASALAEDY